MYKGDSINMIAERLQELGGGYVFGFDSFEGLPSTWRGGSSHTEIPAGDFATSIPIVEDNVELRVGLFNETISTFLSERIMQGTDATSHEIRFLHLDADLHSSTLEVLTALQHLFVPGTIILMDDMVNFPGFRESGLLALADFLSTKTAPEGLEVLAAPFAIHTEDALRLAASEGATMAEVERAIAFRVL